MLVVVLFSSNILILDSFQTHVSSPIITSDKINYKQGTNVIISGWVTYNDEPTSDVLLRIIATNPNEIQIFDEYTTSDIDGIFAISIPISSDAEIGNYSVQVISQCREIHREVCAHQYESISINVEGESNPNEIPDWIRTNAAWWADGSIDDQTFVSGIEFLIKEGTISIPPTQTSTKTSAGIPDWIRTNAAWWADGMISDFDFVKGIEYLVGSGTIRVQTISQIDPPSLELDAGPSNDVESENNLCLGNARCISGTVVKIVDGDILQIDDDIVRFALVDTPKLKYDGGKARGFIEQICPVNSTVVVDQDDKQLEDKFGRLLGVVYCNNMNLNKELLDLGLGDLYSAFCDQSEFSTQPWALKHGCESDSEQ
ncbi:MAG: thermonuclease family protein [Nitrosopumilus sp. (ex Thoosa mismalolli)]|nr:thermonuclease family protein [Nitrosopumilus sp. (ex Thoosa mismalolli)]